MGPEDGNREVPGENKSSWSGHDAEAVVRVKGFVGIEDVC